MERVRIGKSEVGEMPGWQTPRVCQLASTGILLTAKVCGKGHHMTTTSIILYEDFTTHKCTAMGCSISMTSLKVSVRP